VHRFRIVLPLSRELAADEIRAVWDATVQFFAVLTPDPSCKDISRLYAAPAFWQPSSREKGNPEPYNAFEFRLDGNALDVDAVLAAYVAPPAPVYTPVISNGVVLPQKTYKPASAALRKARDTLLATKYLPYGHSLYASPVVTSEMIERYMNLPKGAHHVGLYSFMCAVAGRAKAKGLIITAGDLIQYARELDNACHIKTAKERWRSSIKDEAERALRFAS
jgi:hypothetical protein